MAYNDVINISNTRRIALHELPSPIFNDIEEPTDADVSTWVNGEYDIDTWDNVILTYNPPSYSTIPANANTPKFIWLANYDRSLGIAIVTRFKNGNATNSVGDGTMWHILTSSLDPLVGTDGDLAIFLNNIDGRNGNVYYKISGAWTLTGNIKGPQGTQGVPGAAGEASHLEIGTITTVSNSTPASASITGNPPNQVLNLSIPKGLDGNDGVDGITPQAPNLSPGTITTLNPNDAATANIGGTYPNWTLNIGIPKGDSGTNGTDGFKFTNNVNNSVYMLPWSVNAYGTMASLSPTPFTAYLPDVNNLLPNNGIGNWVVVVNSTATTITIDLQHGSSVSPIKLSLAAGEACTYFAAGINPLNSLGYRWVSLNRF